ncbi:MAG TPA: hypothetical protein VMC79_04090 [Rectinemataceae bacterium]|nr:hypothetical protein [Rectinemataceae bacterium]
MRHVQFGPAAPRDPTPRQERPGGRRALLSLILLLAYASGAHAMGTREQDPVLAQARTDIAAAQVSVDAARHERDKLKAAQLYQDASQRFQGIVDSLQARLKAGSDPGGRIRSLLTTVLLSKARVDRELKNYDASITSLTAVIRQDPDRFDQANGQIREIIGIREKYAQIAADLFSVIKTKDMSLPANQDYVNQRTRELQDLDPYGNQDILIKISEAILKSQNLRAMRSLMTQARTLLDGGKYGEAVSVYEKGFDIYRQQYEDAGYDLLDDQTRKILVVDAAGNLSSLVVDANGTVLQTDRTGQVLKSPDGVPLPALDTQGRPRRLSFLLAGGRERLQNGQGSVVEYASQNVAAAASQADAARDSAGALAGLQSAVDALGAAFSAGDAARAEAAWQPVQAALAALESSIQAIDSSGRKLETLGQQLPKKRGSADISYIQYAYPSYADLFLRGRPDVADYGSLDAAGDPRWRPEAERGKPEGLEGALLAEYGFQLGKLQSAFEASIEQRYAAALDSLDAGRWEEARASFDAVTSLTAPALRVLALWKSGYGSGGAPDLGPFVAATVDAKTADYQRLDRLRTLATSYSRLAQLAQAADGIHAQAAAFMSAFKPDAPFADSRASMTDYRSRLGSAAASVRALLAGDNPTLALFVSWAADPKADPRSRAAKTDYEQRVAKVVAAIQAGETEIVAFRAQLETREIESQLTTRDGEIRQADALTIGPVSTLPDRNGLHDPTPSRGAAILADQQKALAALQNLVAQSSGAIDSELQAIRDAPEVKAERSRLGEEATRLAALQAFDTEALARALDHKKAADQAIKSADAALADARRLLAASQGKGLASATVRQDLDASQTKLADALARILEWSNNDFDPQKWNDYYNNQYSKLKADRDQADEAYVLNETFRLLDDGQRYYNQQLYDQAGEALDSAQRLWLSKHSEEQPQVRYWQNFVKMAQDTNNKREVKQSEPLYYDISNYLSQARALYARGAGLMKSGDRTAAAQAFDAARQNISYVTRAFPLNAEAGLLTLQILKATDQAAYSESLPSRISAARDLLATDPQTAYSRIADLSKMEPNNATIQNLLRQAEIKTGRRPPEPSKDQIARAASLVAQAERLMRTGRSSDNAQASDLLNQAYTLDPSNGKALADIKYLSILSGKVAQTGPALSPADQALLDSATGQYAAGQYNQARDTLNRLLQAGRMTREILRLDQNLKQLGY